MSESRNAALPPAMGSTLAQRRAARLGLTKAVEPVEVDDKAILADSDAENKAVKRGPGRPKKIATNG